MSTFLEQGVTVLGVRFDAFALFAGVLAIALPVIFAIFVHAVAPGALRFRSRLRRSEDLFAYEEHAKLILQEFVKYVGAKRFEEQSKKKPAGE